MKNYFKLLLVILLAASAPAFAVVQASATALVQSSLTTAATAVFNDLQSWAIGLLGALLLLQLTFTNIKHLFEHSEMPAVLGKLSAGLAWGGISLYIFANGAGIITGVSNFLLTKASGLTGGTPLDPSYPVDLGINMASELLGALDKSQSFLDKLNPFPAMMMGIASVVILVVCAVIGYKIFMLYIETKIVIALSPLSFALLGLDAFREQGFAPLKYLVSLAYRLLILAAILAAMTSVSQVIVASFKTLPAVTDPNVWPPIFAAVIGMGMLGAFAYRSDSIAAMLSSGTSNMSPGNNGGASSAASIAKSGVLGGVAGIAAGIAGAAAGGKAMSEVMKEMTSGAGGAAGAAAKVMSPIGDAPVRPSMAASSSGAPQQSTGAGGVSGPSPAETAAGGGKAPANPTPAPSTSNSNNALAALNASNGVTAAGGPPAAALAAGDAAFQGATARNIKDAVTGAGGTSQQAQAAVDAMNNKPAATAGAAPSMLDNAAALHNAMIGETKQSVSVAMNVNA